MKKTNNQEILTNAINVAIARGWKLPKYGYKVWSPVSLLEPLVIIHTDYDMEVQFNNQAIIFNHDFAKALWGDLPEIAYQYHKSIFRKDDQLIISGARLRWQYHLQQMVIADDPIKYLGENI